MKTLEQWLLLLKLASRNILLYRFRTVVIAGLLGFGAFLAVLGLSILRDIEGSMRQSITASVAGDIQVYSTKAKDELAIFGGGFMGRSDIGTLPDFVPYRDVITQHPNVAAFVPMGMDAAVLGRGNEMDDILDALRAALAGHDPAITADRLGQVRFQLDQLRLELAEGRKLAADKAEIDHKLADIDTAAAPGYLALGAVDETKLQFLETKIAPLSGEKAPIYLNYLGTDIDLFRQNFSKFKVVSGEPLPTGRRGILISAKVREDWLKHMAARIFDRLNKRIHKTGVAIAGDAENERLAADLPRQYGLIVSQLDRGEAESLASDLTAFGIAGDPAVTDLIPRLTDQLKRFLAVNDANFDARYAWFYEHVSPKLRLYEISDGETIILRSYTRSGYVKSVPLKVYGIFTFDGLEDSDLAGALNIVDLISFRELYGQMSEAGLAELAAMRASSGIRELSQENAEDALFGAGADGALEERRNVPAAGAVTETLKVTPVIADEFALDEIQRGMALNGAVILKDHDRLNATMADIDAALKAKDLPLQVVDWQKASGMAGQFVNIVRMALIFAIVIIFIVALVIINNSIIVATLNRTREIGTMRAIGAQRSFVVGLFLAETALTGIIGSIAGTVLAAALLGTLGQKGIPAANDIMTFLFSGPRLYPHLNWSLVLTSPLVMTGIAVLASVYAARYAAQVQPAEAMQEKE